MTIKIGNIELDDNLSLSGIEESEDIVIQSTTAFDGTVDTLTMPGADKRPLQLSATLSGDTLLGSFTLGQITALKSVARASAPVVLIHHRGTYNVVLTGVVDVVAVHDVVDPSDTDLYAATINMLEV